MEQCIKCERNFKVKDLFLQWVSNGEGYVCKNCIKKYKEYTIDPCYAGDTDITFVMAIARIPVGEDFIELSQTCIGYHYGDPYDEDAKEYEKRILEQWLTKDRKVREDLLRQNFNENQNQKDEEVLY